MESFNINLGVDTMVSATSNGVGGGENFTQCENCLKLETQNKSISDNAKFLMNYVENTEKVVAIKAQLENERDQLKRVLEEKNDYIESLKVEESNLRNKLSKALDDNQPLLYELNSIRKQQNELLISKEEFVVKAASLEATMKQVQDLMKIKDEELSNLRQKTESFSQKNIELNSQLNDAKNKLNDLKEKYSKYSTEMIEFRQEKKEYKDLMRTAEKNFIKDQRIFETNLQRSIDVGSDLPKVAKPNVRKRSSRSSASVVQLTDAQIKARENWSGGKPSALEALIRPIEAQPRLPKHISSVVSPISVGFSHGVLKNNSCNVKKKIGVENLLKNTTPFRDNNADRTLSIMEIMKFFKQFTEVPLSPITDIFEDVLQCTNSFVPDDNDDVEENDGLLVIDEPHVNVDSATDETANIAPLQHSPPSLTAVPADDFFEPVIACGSFPIVVTCEENVSVEKEFENELRKLLGEMAIEKCFVVDDVGELKFLPNTCEKLHNMLRIISKCDQVFVQKKSFELATRDLPFFLDLPNESMLSENVVHKTTMIFYILANLVSWLATESGKTFVGIFKNFAVCKLDFAHDAAFEFAFGFAMIRISPLFPLEMKSILDEWFNNIERKIAPTLRDRYKEFVLNYFGVVVVV